jgi:hypothetical protein
MRRAVAAESDGPSPSLTENRSLNWEPHWLEAQGQVRIDSDLLKGATNELRLELLAEGTDHQDSASAANPNELILGDPNPIVRDSGISRSGTAGSTRPALELTCDQIALRVTGASRSQSRIHTAVLSGDVRCQEAPAADGLASRFGVRGEFVQMIDLSSRSGRVEVVGQPAEIRLGPVDLTGPNVNLDVAQNAAWIDGPGVASMPLPRSMSLTAAGDTERATLTWNREMRFDGRTLSCADGISIRGPLQLIRAQSLQISLRRPFILGQPMQANGSPEIESTQVQGDVFLENRTLRDQGIVAIDTARLHRLSIQHVTGAVEGTGPGWIETIRRGAVALPSTPPASMPASEDGLSYVQVQFQKGLTGSLDRREVRFFDEIHAVYGPVDDWSSRIATAQRDQLGRGAFFLRCRELVLLQSPLATPGVVQLEMIAQGNTTIEGKDFQATADRLSYDQSKDLLILEGTQRTGAHIWYQDPQGSKQSEQMARKLEYRPKTNRLKIDDFQFLQFRTRVDN